MADYYTYFSVILPLTAEQQAYAWQLAAQIEAHRQEDQPLPDGFPAELSEVHESWTFEVETTKDGLWLHSQSGGQDSACEFIQHLLRKFGQTSVVTFEWSHDCSHPRTDAYGGGAAYITAAGIKTFTTSEWLQQMAVH